ncbi:MAG: peptidase [Betaproteobacteria bacterium]|nr:peptidase [Betaproteobacteria bacterium]
MRLFPPDRLRHRAGVLILLTAVVAAAGAAAEAAEPGPRMARAAPAPVHEDPEVARVIVKYRADSALRRVQSSGAGETGASAAQPIHAARLSQAIRAPLSDGRVLGPHTQAVRGQGLSSSELARRLRVLPEVEWAVVDERRRVGNLPNDALFSDNQRNATPAVGQWYLRAPSNEALSAINAVGAWTTTMGSASVVVAVLDTGVRPEHPDLQGKLHPGYDFVGLDRGGAATTANDGNGRDSDPTDPGDWTNANECSAGEPASPSSWHGTQVSGLIGAATNNTVGMAGAGWNVMVLPVRVLGRCGGYDSDIIAAMRWAAGVSQNVGVNAVVNLPNPNPARVINMSLGSQGTCTAAYQEVVNELRAAGVTVVAAAGNDTGLKVSVPANCPGALAVSGVRHIGSKVGYSNIGPEVALAAPAGNCVNLQGSCLYPLLTTINLGQRQPGANGYSDGSNYSVGTSFAAPLVAGTVGLMLSVDPTLTPAKIREILQATVRPFPTTRPLAPGEDPVLACRAPDEKDQLECLCTSTTCGAGLLDAGAAVARTLALRPAPAPDPGGNSGGGSSGGGSSGLGWLLGLWLATLTLYALNRRG